MLNPFDEYLLLFFNSIAKESLFFDHLIVLVTRLDLLKGGVLMTLLWWCWFQDDCPKNSKREQIIAGIVATLFALVLARTLASILPLRIRPMHELTLPFEIPQRMYKDALRGWSSFPSDHAALFFGLATTVSLCTKRLGVFALLYTTLIICIPRMITGLHYPSDILAGALIGSGLVCLSTHPSSIKLLSYYPIKLLESSPSWFYALLFFITYQIVTLFNDLRTIADFCIDWIKRL